ncbi:cell division protein PerM [Brachybacterium sp. DNPG3]
MSSKGESLATPMVRGVLAAATSLGAAVALAVIPALAAQVAGTNSTATALDAIIIALNVLVLGHGGGIVLSTGVIDGSVTLTPFGLMALLVLLSMLAMRRVGRALDLVRDDGVLRVRAIRDAGSALASYGIVYAVGIAVLAAIGRSTDAAPVVASAVVSGALVAVLGGLAGLLWSLRREATDTVPGVRVLALLPTPYDAVAKAVLIAVLGLFGAGMGLLLVLLVTGIPAQAALFEQLHPGIVGGIVLTLVQLALLPLLAVWGTVVLCGGTISVGTSTGISLTGSATGVLPALPMLGALPQPGDFPAGFQALMLLPVLAVALGAVRLVRDLDGLALRERAIAWTTYAVGVLVAMLLLAGLSTGGLGDGRLVHLGPLMSTLLLPLVGIVVLTTALVVVVLESPLIPAIQGLVAGLRARVESAEAKEGRADRAAASAASPASATSPGSAPSAGSAGSAGFTGSAASARSAASPVSARTPSSADER